MLSRDLVFPERCVLCIVLRKLTFTYLYLSKNIRSKVLRTVYVEEDIESGDHSTTAFCGKVDQSRKFFFVFKWRFSNLCFLPTSFSKCLCMYVICMHNCNLFDFYADHSVGWHFVLLTVLFALQKLLSFLRSHVLILVCALLVFYSGSCILC